MPLPFRAASTPRVSFPKSARPEIPRAEKPRNATGKPRGLARFRPAFPAFARPWPDRAAARCCARRWGRRTRRACEARCSRAAARRLAARARSPAPPVPRRGRRGSSRSASAGWSPAARPRTGFEPVETIAGAAHYLARTGHVPKLPCKLWDSDFRLDDFLLVCHSVLLV